MGVVFFIFFMAGMQSCKVMAGPDVPKLYCVSINDSRLIGWIRWSVMNTVINPILILQMIQGFQYLVMPYWLDHKSF